jgi:HAD superfamily hydrolase (TIGR01484 family)
LAFFGQNLEPKFRLMLALSQMPEGEAQGLLGLFFDLDDTFLSEGQMSERAFEALFRLRDSGLVLVALTGRPSPWGEVLAQLWPVAGVISENGALAHFKSGLRVEARDPLSSKLRDERVLRLRRVVAQVREVVPNLPPSDDAHGRVSDFTFDIGEFNRATREEIELASSTAEALGARTTRSSVHLHVTFDQEDKATGAVRFLSAQGYDSTRILRRFAFIGDSQNDAPCFAAFRTTIGVHNLRGQFSVLPRYQTGASRSQGFVEAAEYLVRTRS